jgi:hypothetical protein
MPGAKSMSHPSYRQAADLEVHETEDGLVVFDPRTDQVHHLNHSAGVIFELCREQRNAERLVSLVSELYTLNEPPAEAVVDGLRKLVAQGILIEFGGE